jgi:transposase-like protein
MLKITKEQPQKRKTHTNDEKLAIIKKYKHSTLSKAKFCEINAISKSALYKWINDFADVTISTPKHLPQAFIPVKVATPDSNCIIPEKGDYIILQIHHNIILKIPGTIAPSYISQLIQGVTQC